MRATTTGFGWLAVVLGAGCTVGSTGEESGAFSFYQPTDYPGDGLGDRDADDAVALGSRVDLAVLGWDEATDGPLTWSVDAGEALSLEGDGAVGRFRAVAEGEGQVRATAADGTTDVITLTVAPLGASAVVVDNGLLWGGDVGPAEWVAAGRTLRPGAAITLGATLTDATGARMSGFDFLTWTADPGLLTLAPSAALVNSVTATAVGVAGDDTVTVDGGGLLDLGLQGADAVNTLAVFSTEPAPDGTYPEIDALTAEAGLMLIGLAGFDAAGRFVVPGPADAPAIAVSDGDPAGLVAAEWSPELGGMALQLCAGVGTLSVTFLGGDLLLPFVIAPSAAAPAGCP
jgi:hypothetical protein